MQFEVNLIRGISEFALTSGFFNLLFSFFAVYLPYIIIASAVWFFLKHPWRLSIYGICFAGLTALLSRGIITEIIRFFYDRPRPFTALDFTPLFLDSNPSFPSGHAAFFFALAFTILLFNKKIGWLFIFLALLNGAGRVFAGVHWPTDILGGMVVAILSVWIVGKFIGRYRPEDLTKQKALA